MKHVHGMGRSGWWCYTLVVIAGHLHHGNVRASMKVHSPSPLRTFIVGHLEEHRGDHGTLRIRKATTGVHLVQHYNVCVSRLVRMKQTIHNA